MSTKYSEGRYIGQVWQDDRPQGGALYPLVMITIGAAMGITLMMIARSCDRVPSPAVAQIGCVGCHNKQMAMAQYLKRNGSRNPEEMAYALLKTQSPRLLAAVAVVESGGNPTVRKSGYKRRHDGAYQVNAKHWGAVPLDAIGQTLQAESILSELTETMPLKKALAVYGGDSTTKYQRRVLAELVRVP